MKVLRGDTRGKYAGFHETIKHGNTILLEGVNDHFWGQGEICDFR